MKKIILFGVFFLPVLTFAQDTLNEGTIINVKLLDKLNSRKLHAGEILDLQLAENITKQNKILVFAGAKVTATVTEAQRAKDFGKTAQLNVTVDYLYLPNGKAIKLRGSIQGNGRNSIDWIDRGPNIKFKEGTVFKVYIDKDTIINL